MHEATNIDSKPKDEPKSTLDLLADASVIEEESRETNQQETEKKENRAVGTGDSTSSAVDGDGTAGEAEPMQIDAERQEDEVNKSSDVDVDMEDAGEASVQESSTNEATAKDKTGQKQSAETSQVKTTEAPPENKCDSEKEDSEDSKIATKPTEATIQAKEEKDEKEVSQEGTNDTEKNVTDAGASAEQKKENDIGENVQKTPEKLLQPEEEKKESTPKEAQRGEHNDGSKTESGTKQNSQSPTDSAIKSNSQPTAGTTAKTTSQPASASPPPPVLKGTLSYNVELRRHLIRGMWNYENSTVFPPQRFELIRTLNPDEKVTELPKDGEFHGSFSLAYFHTTSKGKQKERSKVIPESGVKIKFTKCEGKDSEYKVDGKGTNQFGIFHINGTATPSSHDGDPTLNIVLRKRYEPSTQPPASADATPVPSSGAAGSAKKVSDTKSKAVDSADNENGPLPPPAQSYSSGVVCLRGQLSKEESNDLGITEVVHRVSGMWAAGLNFILADPDNSKGLLSRFEYEHKSSVPSNAFPISGRYSGWFDLSNEDGSRTRINERDVVLKFRKNDAGYYNVEGKGSNVFGKYSITGTLTKDNVITIFRHFQQRKIKSNKAVTSAPPPINAPQARRTSTPVVSQELKLKIDDVKAPDEKGPKEALEPIKPPMNSTYSAVSRGVLRVNEDGSHSCQGKWAVTREHFTNGQTSNFNFRLEPHFASEAASSSDNKRTFPLDSAMYKGSFQLKKQGSRYQTIVDQQIVMKFRMNTQGSYNVYGKGVNAIGEFNLMGTLVMSGKTGGQVEVYRMYPPERLANPIPPKSTAATGSTTDSAQPAIARSGAGPASLPERPPMGSLQRRESTRLVKLPSKLEDDDPSALLSRTMEKCAQILRIIREKDIELGAFFNEPVDPVALGIPTYHQVIKEPMDLKTIHRKMEAGEVKNPDEFARLCRLVFENAMTFNIDPAHSVHQAARQLLIQFNQKYRDVERMVQNIRRAQGSDDERKKKGDKKRKREEPPKSLKKRRFEEAQEMAAENSRAVSSLLAATPVSSSAPVTRDEFNLLFKMIQQLQRQVVQTQYAVADLSPGDENDAVLGPTPSAAQSSYTYAPPAQSAAPAQEKKKSAKRKSDVLDLQPVPVDDSTPLTLDEQELLTETINQLQQEQLGGVIQIIREAAPVGADEDEIDLEIDQLDHKTQRKLLRHVSKYVKKKGKAKKKPKTLNAQQARKNEKSFSSTAPKKSKTAPKPRAAADSFMAFGSKDDSESDSDEESGKQPLSQSLNLASQEAAKDFRLSEGLGDLHDDDDHDIGSGGIAANWNISKPVSSETEKKVGEEDDAWGAAREEAAAAKAREAERKAREEKVKAEAEIAKQQRLAEAAARGEEIRIQRAEEEEKEAQLKEQQEKEAEEAAKAARAEARANVQSVEQTVDLDAQRDIMKQYEQSFLDKDMGSASPSSDFGF